jgi:hypothetical protein
MALSTASDYKTALFRVISTGEVDIETWVRSTGMSRADAQQIASEYNTWLHTLPSRIHQTSKKTAK